MLNDYFRMIEYRRPAGSDTEWSFIRQFLADLPGYSSDASGNIIIQVGDDPTILWSSHTDTVHTSEGMQRVVIDGDWVRLGRKSKSNCLGADCTTGVWLMREMILANKPGLYIFHYGEEKGGIGSNWIAKNSRPMLEGIKAAIAFDRYDFRSIITHQFDRCCSEVFGTSLAQQLGDFINDPDGIFTDTANYTDLIGECTNISVGYFDHHTRHERQSIKHMQGLLVNLLELDVDQLIYSRQPAEIDPDGYGYGSWEKYYGFGGSKYFDDRYDSGPKDLPSLLKAYPVTAAAVLEEYGVTFEGLDHAINEHLRISKLALKKAS